MIYNKLRSLLVLGSLSLCLTDRALWINSLRRHLLLFPPILNYLNFFQPQNGPKGNGSCDICGDNLFKLAHMCISLAIVSSYQFFLIIFSHQLI
jgi:hypothetical protein